LIVGAELTTLQRCAAEIKAAETKKVILDLDDGQNCVKSHLEKLIALKKDLIADVEYLAQTVEYSTF